MRWIDVMNDVAFVVMALQERRRSDLAARFLTAYLETTGDYQGLGVLRFYLVYRSMVRAKVGRVRARQVQSPDERGRLAAEYRRYINLARSSGQRSSAAIIITHGLAGSGKTTSSQWLLELLGAIRIRTDVERKRLHGVGIAEGSDSPLGKGRCTSPTPRAEPIRVSVSWRAGQPPMATSLSSTARSCSAANAICFVRRHRRSACRL